jgi:hypothetical protein
MFSQLYYIKRKKVSSLRLRFLGMSATLRVRFLREFGGLFYQRFMSCGS